jgi:predicted GNAT family acetyltransferase
MQVHRFDDTASFRETTMSYLVADEARHNLLLGISATIIEKPHLYELVDLWAVLDGDEVVLAALRTPPHNLVLGRPSDAEALQALTDRLVEEGQDLPGVVAAIPEVDSFVAAWTAARDLEATLVLRQGIYQLTEVLDVPPAPGAYRAADRSDRDLVVRWMLAFGEESLPHDVEVERQTRLIEARLDATDASGLWLWVVDGEPVSMSGYGGATPSGIRIGPVYTPPGLRGHGYATSLVASQSRWLLGSGRSFVFLYTDLDNPTSNALYRRIGYRMIAEAGEVRFDPLAIA